MEFERLALLAASGIAGATDFLPGGAAGIETLPCAACGASGPREARASGKGRVYATSLVCRAATPETRAHVPYNIVLVDTAEGFRMMAHGEIELAIGDAVKVRFEPFAGRIVPYFEKVR